ncbi:MAG TPA: YraN family protein [Sphaerochaetaceae bacterium]|nr:YraN family protein [Sphaerochaetaceae bacterium]
MKRRNTTVEKGRVGEQLAATLLARTGYHILERNYRSPGSELDIVALHKKSRTLVCVEVKRWVKAYYPVDDIRYAVPMTKMFRLRKGLSHFIATHPRLEYDAMRIDVILLYGNRLIHMKGEQ